MKLDVIENILEALNKSSAKYLKIEGSKRKIEIVRSITEDVHTVIETKIEEPQVVSEGSKEDEKNDHIDITSSYVGFFQRASKSGDKLAVSLRQLVEPGQVVAYINSMNIQYEVTANEKGKIVEILVEDGQAVEFEQPLFRLRLNNDDQEGSE